MVSRIAWRMAGVGILVHAGLVFGIYASLELKLSGVDPWIYGKVMVATGLLYGAWFVAAFYALRPVYRAYVLYQRLMDWKRLLMDVLPLLGPFLDRLRGMDEPEVAPQAEAEAPTEPRAA